MASSSRCHLVLSKRVSREAVKVDMKRVVKVLLATKTVAAPGPPSSFLAPPIISSDAVPDIRSEGEAASSPALSTPSPSTPASPPVQPLPNPARHRGGALSRAASAISLPRVVAAVSIPVAVRSVINQSHYSRSESETRADGLPAVMLSAVAAVQDARSSSSSSTSTQPAPPPPAPVSISSETVSMTQPQRPPRFRHPAQHAVNKRLKEEDCGSSSV